MSRTASSSPQLAGGEEPVLQSFDIGHPAYRALIEPDGAFWALVANDAGPDAIARIGELHRAKAKDLAREMTQLRFQLKPSAVYFNATERCNLNCGYCYIPADMRRHGSHMTPERVGEALERLHAYFRGHMPDDRLPQVIFHGAEPLLNRDAIFGAIETFGDRFRFGVQTNATLLDDDAIEFLTGHGVGIGLSLDGPTPEVADRTRQAWNGKGVFDSVVRAMERLKGYPGFNVICTMTTANLDHLTPMVQFLHEREVPACMLNLTRCTLQGARPIRGEDEKVASAFVAALEETQRLFRQTGRKLVVANFANILIAILAPTARRLMCDISPCGGGRSFFALSANGDLFPCSEFVGLPAFNGGNLFERPIDEILETQSFRLVTGRTIERIEECKDCAIRHFCGAPCPAEAHEMNGGMDEKGAFCEFYKEQVRFALRLIADGRHQDFLWDGWDEGTTEVLAMGPDGPEPKAM